jgi:predicted metal-dependent HD superfamily phosphohydrolase
MICFNLERWRMLREASALPGPLDEEFAKLIACYSEPQRRYHNAHHIDDCLQEFDSVREKALWPASVEYAIWLHDVVYDPHANDNEEQSARFATECLKATEDLAARVSDLILATKTHKPGITPDAALLIDIDLSILGKSRERFAEYEKGIRDEYSWVPTSVYCEKRGDILRAFLQRDRIFTTPFFFDRYEVEARTNLANSIVKLDHQREGE